MQHLTEQQYESLINSICNSLRKVTIEQINFSLTMSKEWARMEAIEEGERIVDKWMKQNKITLKED